MIATPSIEIVNLGDAIPYSAGLEAQRSRRESVERGHLPEAILLLEHAPVFTLGRNANESNLLASRDALAELGIQVVEVDRGGDVTYHGPGQLVAYPILHLDRRGLGIRQYLRLLEQAIIDTLAHFGIAGDRMEGFTGVWVNGAKVAAIGIAVHRGVAYHGIAINVDPNMDHWGLIVPCGIPDKPVTSLKRILGSAPPMTSVEAAFTGALKPLLLSE